MIHHANDIEHFIADLEKELHQLSSCKKQNGREILND
jgi:hypothetical protein